MQVLLDECLPRRLKLLLVGHVVVTVAEAGWRGRTNGDLLALAEGQFDAFVTVDRNVASGDRVLSRVAIVVISARSNRLEDLRPIVPAVLHALAAIRPAEVVKVGPRWTLRACVLRWSPSCSR